MHWVVKGVILWKLHKWPNKTFVLVCFRSASVHHISEGGLVVGQVTEETCTSDFCLSTDPLIVSIAFFPNCCSSSVSFSFFQIQQSSSQMNENIRQFRSSQYQHALLFEPLQFWNQDRQRSTCTGDSWV